MLLLFVFLIFSLPPSPLLLLFILFYFLFEGGDLPRDNLFGGVFSPSLPLLFALTSDFFLLFFPLFLSPHTSFSFSSKYG